MVVMFDNFLYVKKLVLSIFLDLLYYIIIYLVIVFNIFL